MAYADSRSGSHQEGCDRWQIACGLLSLGCDLLSETRGLVFQAPGETFGPWGVAMLQPVLPVLDETPMEASCSGPPGGSCIDPNAGPNPQKEKMRRTFRSKTGVMIEVVDLSDSRFEALVAMYEVFEPKRSAQGLPPIGRERIVAWLRRLQTNGHNLLALSDNRVIGHALLCPVDDERAEFAIFLAQKFRNQGIGTALTETTLDEARRLNLRKIWLSVETSNRCAIRVYRKTGFQLSGLFGPEQEMTLDLTKNNEDGGTSDESENSSNTATACGTKAE